MSNSELHQLSLEELYKRLEGWQAGGTGYQAIADAISRKQMQALLSLVDRQVEAAAKLERQTDTLIDLTRSLKVFTVVLVVFTVGLFVIEAFHLFERHQASVQPAPHTQQTNQTTQKPAHD